MSPLKLIDNGNIDVNILLERKLKAWNSILLRNYSNIRT